MIKTFLLVACIFMSVWMGAINIAKLHYGKGISATNFIIFSIGVTGIITHVIGIW